MHIAVDTHTHTMVSHHVYSTVRENAILAAQKGLAGFAMTDHAPYMVDGGMLWHFDNLKRIPRRIEGVTVIRGAELNVMDFYGNLDLEGKALDGLEWVIASMHTGNCYQPGTLEENTRTWLNVCRNPAVDVIGHCGTEENKFYYEQAIPKFKEYGKIVEINSSSVISRPSSVKNCREIALLCKKYEVPVVVSSDAHICYEVGEFTAALSMLEQIGFPEKLVLNAGNMDRIAAHIKEKRGVDIYQDA